MGLTMGLTAIGHLPSYERSGISPSPSYNDGRIGRREKRQALKTRRLQGVPEPDVQCTTEIVQGPWASCKKPCLFGTTELATAKYLGRMMKRY